MTDKQANSLYRQNWILDSNFLFPMVVGLVSAFGFILDSKLLVFIGISSLIYLLQNKSFKEADRVGLVYGFVFYSLGLYWLFSVGELYQATSLFVLISFEILAIILLTILFALSTLAICIVPLEKRKSIDWFIFIVTPVFALMEFTKTWFFSGFPWFQASHVFSQEYFRGWFSLAGELGVSFIFYFILSVSVYVFSNKKQTKSYVLLLSIILVFFVVTIVLNKIEYTEKSHSGLTFQLINDHVYSGKTSKIERIERIEKYQQLALSSSNIDVSIWPESSTGEGKYSEIKKDIKKGFDSLNKQDKEVLFGTYLEIGGRLKNSIFSSNQDREVYSKQHLVPIGEYAPDWFAMLDVWIPGSLKSTMAVDKAFGSEIKIEDLYIGSMICYEVMFGEEFRLRTNRSNILLVISNLEALKPGWVKDYFWRLAKIRSMEHQKPLLQSSNFGYTGVIDASGSELKINSNEFNTLNKHVIARNGLTIYAKFGDKIVILICLLFLIIGVWKLK